MPISITVCWSWRISATSASSPAIRRRRSRRITPRRSIFWPRCTAANCRPTLPVMPEFDYRLPRYDQAAFLIEAELLLDWYLVGAEAPAQTAARASLCAALADGARSGARRAADLGAARLSFAQPDLAAGARRHRADRRARFSGRADRPRRLRRRLAASGCPRRCAGNPGNDAARPLRARTLRYGDRRFDTAGFTLLYATLAAQRATKILGIFARLDRRDGKSQYLRHMPRLWNYLQRSLAHPALAPLKAWYAANVPAPDGL